MLNQFIRWRWSQPLAALAAIALGLGASMASGSDPSGEPAPSPTTIRVAAVNYSGGKTSRCFASGFLDDVARQTNVRVERQFESVAVESPDLFKYPFIVLTGEGAFTLSDAEVANLRAYLRHGGFLLASAGCTSPQWATAFRTVMARVLPDNEAKKIPMDHPIFHTLYDIQSIQPARVVSTADLEIDGYELDNRMAVVFSPTGLNDTGNAGGKCCCCGGNEIRNARLINADILAYALTH